MGCLGCGARLPLVVGAAVAIGLVGHGDAGLGFALAVAAGLLLGLIGRSWSSS